jgi:hypothetical protein
MAISFVGTTSTTFTGSASTYSSPSLASIDVKQNDLLIVCYGCARPNSEGNLALADGLTAGGAGSSTASGTARAVYWRLTWARVGSNLSPSFAIPSGGDGRANICTIDVYRGADPGTFALFNTSATNRRPNYSGGGAAPEVGHWIWGVGMASGPVGAADHTSLFNATGVTNNGNYQNPQGTQSSFCLATCRKPVTGDTTDANLGQWSLTDSDSDSRARAFVNTLVPIAELDGTVGLNTEMELSGDLGVGVVTEPTDPVAIESSLSLAGEVVAELPPERQPGFIRSRQRRVYFDPTSLEPEPKKEKPVRRRTPKTDQATPEPIETKDASGPEVRPLGPVPPLPGADLGEALLAVEAVKDVDRKVKLRQDDEALLALLMS